jgi:hypothetical protein
MKLRDLEQHLRKQGCIFFREGGAHSVWLNPSNRDRQRARSERSRTNSRTDFRSIRDYVPRARWGANY